MTAPDRFGDTTPVGKWTPGKWHVVPNDGAYVKDSGHARLRIERVAYPEYAIALIISDIIQLPAIANAHLIAAGPMVADYIKRRADEGDEEAAAIWRFANGAA